MCAQPDATVYACRWLLVSSIGYRDAHLGPACGWCTEALASGMQQLQDQGLGGCAIRKISCITCLCTCMLKLFVCMHAYIHTYIHTHTHTHTDTINVTYILTDV
jgi:hypothetical protein